MPMSEKNTDKKREKPVLPLAHLQGAKPPAPEWFVQGLTVEHSDHWVEVDGGNTRYRLWGDEDKPGLILVHGGVAHKGWWDFIAPFFTAQFQVLALDLYGMGESCWRDYYEIELYAQQVHSAAQDAGFFERAEKPWLVGHSFGGFVTLGYGALFGDTVRGAVVIDSPIRPPKEQRRSAPPSRGGKVYKTLEEALARFRLLPNQECENLFLLDHIARQSLKEVEGGWTWLFDPELWLKMRYDMKAAIEMVGEISCPVTLIRGEESSLVTDELWTFMQDVFPQSPYHVSIPQARHHVMLDQPLALVSALRVILQGRI